MSKFSVPDHLKKKPEIQMASLIDIVFLTLVFFMTMSVFDQQESLMSISVPKATESNAAKRTPGEIVINIDKTGSVVVNQQVLNAGELERMLQQVSSLFPDQPVIIRADELAYHKAVINVLDTCARADIWNVSFATTTEQE